MTAAPTPDTTAAARPAATPAPTAAAHPSAEPATAATPASRRSLPIRPRRPSPRYLREVAKESVREDIRTLAFFVRIYCDGNHADRPRTPHSSPAVDAGAYTQGVPTLCAECSEHLTYGEARRVFCTLDPKPFCAHCEVHCFKDSERAWNRQMMRYSGPRSLLHGYALDGARHFAGSVRTRIRRWLHPERDPRAHIGR